MFPNSVSRINKRPSLPSPSQNRSEASDQFGAEKTEARAARFGLFSGNFAPIFAIFKFKQSSNNFLDQSGIGLIPNRNFACSIGLFIGAIRSLNEIIKGALKALQGVWTRENPFGGLGGQRK